MNESPSCEEPELLARPQHDLGAEPRQVHGADRGRAQVVEHEVTVRDRVQRVLHHAVEAERARHRLAARVPVHAGERARAERQLRGRARGVGEPLEVAPEHPEVREQVVREVDGLRALQVRVARASASPRGARRGRRARPSGRAAACAPPCTGRARTAPCRSRPGRSATVPCGPCRRPARRSPSGGARSPCGCPRRPGGTRTCRAPARPRRRRVPRRSCSASSAVRIPASASIATCACDWRTS